MFKGTGFLALISALAILMQVGCRHVWYNGSGPGICHRCSRSAERPGHWPEGGVCGGGQCLWIFWHGGGDHVQVCAVTLCIALSLLFKGLCPHCVFAGVGFGKRWDEVMH